MNANRWGACLLAAVVLVALALPAAAAPMFPDVPDAWATDAVRALAARGVLEGYPDGTFKGDRAATRYEVAMIVARLLARMEQEHATFLSRPDLDEVQRLAQQYKSELDAYGVKVQDLENRVAVLDRRVTDLERVTFYGSLRANGTSNNVSGARFVGTTANPAIDYSNGRLIFNGLGATSRALLGVHARLNDDLDAGMEFIAFSATGESSVEQYWGVTPPYNSNPFLAQAATAPNLQPESHVPFTRMTLDRFWMQDRPADAQVILGTYALKTVGEQVCLGIRNPNVNAPAILPFYGFQASPLQAQDKVQYEFDYSLLPTGSLNRTWMGATAASYDFGPVTFGLSLMHVDQDTMADGSIVAAGATVLPSANGTQLEWRDYRTGAFTQFVGPQDETIFGGNLVWDVISKRLFLHANAAHSQYNPDKTKTNLDVKVPGDQFSVGLDAVLGQFRPGLEFVYADPTYDTLMMPYSVNPGFPVFLPYGNWYSTHYQLHDYIKYPTNRRGPRATLSWGDADTKIWASYEHLDQVKPTTFGQLTTPGNAEALFPLILTAGVDKRGYTNAWGIGGGHQFGENGFRVAGSIYDYKLRRATVPVDDVDFGQRFYRIEVGHPVGDQLDVSLNFSLLDFKGHTGLANQSFQQTFPGLTATWTPARNVSLTVNARIFNFRDHLVGANNWHGNQIATDFKVSF